MTKRKPAAAPEVEITYPTGPYPPAPLATFPSDEEVKATADALFSGVAVDGVYPPGMLDGIGAQEPEEVVPATSAREVEVPPELAPEGETDAVVFDYGSIGGRLPRDIAAKLGERMAMATPRGEPIPQGRSHPHVGRQVRFARYDRSGELLETNAWVHAVHPATLAETDEEMQARGETRFRRGAEPETVDLFYDWPDEPFRRYAERVPYSAEPAESTWSFRGEGR